LIEDMLDVIEETRQNKNSLKFILYILFKTSYIYVDN